LQSRVTVAPRSRLTHTQLLATPLHVVSTPEDARILCDAGADPNATTIGGYALVSLIAATAARGVQWLPGGDRPLHWHHSDPGIVHVLLDGNANPRLLGVEGQTPLQLALARGSAEAPPETERRED